MENNSRPIEYLRSTRNVFGRRSRLARIEHLRQYLTRTLDSTPENSSSENSDNRQRIVAARTRRYSLPAGPRSRRAVNRSANGTTAAAETTTTPRAPRTRASLLTRGMTVARRVRRRTVRRMREQPRAVAPAPAPAEIPMADVPVDPLSFFPILSSDDDSDERFMAEANWQALMASGHLGLQSTPRRLPDEIGQGLDAMNFGPLSFRMNHVPNAILMHRLLPFVGSDEESYLRYSDDDWSERDTRIRSLPLTRWTNENGTFNCGVCLEDVRVGDELRVLPCGVPKRQHKFHKQCIDRWLHNSPSCPLCRRNI